MTYFQIDAWRLRADGTRIGRAHIYGFQRAPNLVNGYPEVVAVYADAGSGRMGIEYLENFEIDVAPEFPAAFFEQEPAKSILDD